MTEGLDSIRSEYALAVWLVVSPSGKHLTIGRPTDWPTGAVLAGRGGALVRADDDVHVRHLDIESKPSRAIFLNHDRTSGSLRYRRMSGEEQIILVVGDDLDAYAPVVSLREVESACDLWGLGLSRWTSRRSATCSSVEAGGYRTGT